jgi:hypothetical protein
MLVLVIEGGETRCLFSANFKVYSVLILLLRKYPKGGVQFLMFGPILIVCKRERE